MINTIICPRCNTTFEVSDDVSDYDWNSGVSYNGIAEETCPGCHEPITIEAHASIIYVEVADGD